MSKSHAMTKNGRPVVELSTTSLATGAQLFVWSVRQWLVTARERRCIKRDLIPRYHAANCVDAITLLDEMMYLLAVAASRPVQIRCLECSALSPDETRLVETLRAVQRADSALAGEHLSSMLSGPFSRAFLRPAQLYVEALSAADLGFTGARHLTLVDGARS